MTRVSGRYMCLDKQVYVADCATLQTATHDFEPLQAFIELMFCLGHPNRLT